jgi:hypothetical protein
VKIGRNETVITSIVGTDFHAGHIANRQRRAALGLKHDVFQVGRAGDVAPAADHELELGQLDRLAADIGVAGADGVITGMSTSKSSGMAIMIMCASADTMVITTPWKNA